MLYYEPFPSIKEGEPAFAWALRVWNLGQQLVAVHGNDLVLMDTPAQQWRMVNVIFDEASRASRQARSSDA